MRYAGSGRLPPAIVALAVLVSLGTLIPLGFVVTMTITTGWDTAVRLIFRRRIG